MAMIPARSANIPPVENGFDWFARSNSNGCPALSGLFFLSPQTQTRLIARKIVKSKRKAWPVGVRAVRARRLRVHKMNF